MKPDRKHDTTGQLSREGQKERDTRERSKVTDALEKEAKQIAEDIDNRYRSSNSDTAGVQNSQGGTGGGNLGGLGGPGNFGGGRLDKSGGR
jgi:hypothetical protein